jgi:hypothetical protein
MFVTSQAGASRDWCGPGQNALSYFRTVKRRAVATEFRDTARDERA